VSFHSSKSVELNLNMAGAIAFLNCSKFVIFARAEPQNI
jgi:hypothetical protein